MFKLRRVLAGAWLAVGLTVAPLSAHEGHDHGNEGEAAALRAAPRAASTADVFELVLVARGGRLAIFLDRAVTNEPVTEADIAVQTPAGSGRAEPQPDGSYGLAAPWSTTPGEYDIVVTVTVGAETELFPLDLHVPGPEPERPPSRPDGAAWAAGLVGLAPLTAAFGGFTAGAVLTLLTTRRRRSPSVALVAILTLALALGFAGGATAHEGHDQQDGERRGAAVPTVRDQAQRLPDGGVFVPKPTQRLLALRTAVPVVKPYRAAVELTGRVVPDPNASGFVQSAIGGRLSPPPGGFPGLGTRVKAGDALAYVTPPIQAIDLSDMRQRQGELDQQISIVERRLTRLEPLGRSGAVTQAQLDESRLELQGLLDRRTALDHSRQPTEVLRAPVDGVIAERNAVAGQMTSTSAVVFQIVEPRHLWVEAQSFEGLAGLEEASGRLPSGQVVRLTFRGVGLAERNQAVPVHFEIEGDPGHLRLGQFVTVLAARGSAREGLAIPRGSVVRARNGQQVVYAHTAPERFEAREVRIEPLDGEHVLVAAGLDPGLRIVVSGAELLDQVR